MAERRPGSDRGQPLVDWEAAFSYYASLPPETRSYAAVAKRFGVSARTVETHGRRGRWRDRIAAIEAAAATQADRKLSRARADQLADFHKLIDATCVAYARQLASGQVLVTTSSLVGLIKLSLQLHAEPEAENLPLATAPEWVALRARLISALAAHPEALEALITAIAEEAP